MKLTVYDLTNIKNDIRKYLISESDIYVDGSEPNLKNIKELAKAKESDWDNFYKVNYGPNAINNYKPYTWLQHCNLIIVEIDEETFNSIKGEN
ncbi:hypothetical protein JL768_02390 [Staphylococcus pseudintermedius]|nr:hypothetical protein [Staphylococcus pseudintermedius]